MKKYDYLVVGAGLYGAVFANQAKAAGRKVLVVEKRPHIAGNIYTEEDLMVEGDPDKLARVFDNLLRNAVAYSYRGTNIDVRAYGEGVAVVIVFSNQGEPIPKQKLQTVFEKFYRADNSRSSQTGGAGLGLSVAKEIVELHEGTIEAFSDIQSTRFVVRLKRLLPKGQRQSGGVI